MADLFRPHLKRGVRVQHRTGLCRNALVRTVRGLSQGEEIAALHGHLDTPEDCRAAIAGGADNVQAGVGNALWLDGTPTVDGFEIARTGVGVTGSGFIQHGVLVSTRN